MNSSRRLRTATSNISKFFKRRKRNFLLLVMSAFFALAANWILQQFVSLRVYSYNPRTAFTISNETVTSPPLDIFTTGPSLFASVGRVHAYLSSPYASAFKIFDIWMSLDNSTWTRIPLLSSQTSNRTQMADLGLVGLDNPHIVVYTKYYIPPQTLVHPINATKVEIENSFTGYIQLVRQATSRDTTQSVLTFFVFFGIILQVSDFLLKRRGSERSEKEEKRISKQTKRKSRKKS